MKKNKIEVVFSSHLSDEEDDIFIDHLKKTIGVTHKIHIYKNNNKYSLSELYNKALNSIHNNSIIIFCHNDIEFKTLDWGKKILRHFNNSDFGIIGVAGTTFISDNGCWWSDRSKMCGTVEHTNGIQNWISEYSNKINGIKEVVHVDGLFICVDPNKITQKFDEDFGKFHFYDIGFNLPNYLDGVRIGVIDNVKILHKSIGQTNQSWEDNKIKFVEKYKEDLPVRFVPDKLRVLICCQFFKNYTGSEVSNFELAKNLKNNIGCDVTIISSVIGDPLYTKAKNMGIDVYHISNAPNYMIGENNMLNFIKNEKEFDILHINHKPIGEQILKMYPNTPAVMHVRSEVIPVFEEPIVNPMILKYISIRKSITDYIKGFNIKEDKIIEIDNPFDTSRFNKNYKKINNEKEIILFIGTLDHLRKNILFDLKEMVEKDNQILWIIGEDTNNYSNQLIGNNVKYLGVKSNVEDYIKKCDYTAGIFKGRTTIEGYLCGKPGWIYKVNKGGEIESKEFTDVPDNLEIYSGNFSTNKVFNLYEDIISEYWYK